MTSTSTPAPSMQQSPWLVAAYQPARRAEWDCRMAELLRIDALMRAEEAFGEQARHDQRKAHEHARIAAHHGPGWRNIPVARAALDPKLAQEGKAIEDRLLEDYYQPVWEAQRQAVRCPAPDLAAALFKVDLIDTAEAWNDKDMERDCFEIVAEDMARLAGEIA